MKKFFISSTFLDMHVERDIIQNIVQPAVNNSLNEQGEYVSFSDLRWGIDTMTDATEQKILDTCFDEIDSCKPYFVVFIGGRYGWIPSKELLIPYEDKFGEVNILEKSITELEILYALKLNENDLGRCLFYVKDDVEYESEEDKKKLEELKSKLEKIAPSQIRHYKTLTNEDSKNALSNQLIKDICGILSNEKTLSWQERIANQMKVKSDTALPGITIQWLDELKNAPNDLTVLLFPECRIKESFIINFLTQIKNKKNESLFNRLFRRRNKEVYSIYINIGASKDLSVIHDLLRYLIFQICETCMMEVPSIDNISDTQLRVILADLLKNCVKNGDELYIIISGYDKLIDAQNTNWLPDYIKNVKWVVALSDKSIAESLSSSTHTKCIYGTSHLRQISPDKQIAAYEEWSGKTLNPIVKEAITNLPCGDDYIMVELIFNRLLHFDGKDIPNGNTKDIPRYMEQYVRNIPCAKGNTNDAIIYLLKGDFEKFNYNLCEFIVICIAFLNRGLTVTDIEKLAQRVNIPWTELDIIKFLNYESFLLTSYEDGRYDISSNVICNSLTKWYHLKFKYEYSYAIYDYLNELPNEASIKIDNYWFLCYISNHFKEYLDYLRDLYDIRKDNTNFKAAFFPLFINAEAIEWFICSLKKEKPQYNSTKFIADLISIVAQTFSSYNPHYVDELIAATQNMEDTSGNLETIFRQHYTSALTKIKNYDYKGFKEDFDTCLELSQEQFKKNPPQLQYLDEDKEHEYPIASLQDILETEYRFSFIEEMAALMSKYADLPKEFQDEVKASYYADKANEIRTKISKVSYIQPKDIQEIKKGNATDVTRKNPSLLRGKAIELCKQADRTQEVDTKIKLLKEAIEILDDILSIPEDDLVGEFKDSQKALEYESTVYNECHRDLVLCYERLSDFQEGKEKLYSLDVAFKHISIYAKDHHNEQALNDILRITRALVPLASLIADPSMYLHYCISGYVAFAETTPRTSILSFEERLFAELSADFFIKEIKSITSQSDNLRSQWIQECKNHINSFQSLGKLDAMIWMILGLHRSYSYYVHDLNLHAYLSAHISLMGNLLQNLEKYLHVSFINSIYEDAQKDLEYSLSKDDSILLLHIVKMYSQHMIMQGQFDKSLEASQVIIDFCQNNSQETELSEMTDIEYQARKLNSCAYLEQGNISKSWASIDKIATYTDILYQKEQSLENLIELANAKLNQVILWDKMSVEPGLDLWIIEHHKRSEAQKQLYDTYLLCYNYEGKDEQLSKLMRRIRQSYEIISEKGLGYLATPKVLELVKLFKQIAHDATLAENEGRHEEFIDQLEKLLRGIKNSRFVDIYFEADWYASILFMLGQDAWKKGLNNKTEEYYEEAVRVRYELDTEGIGQNKESFAQLLYFYALTILSKPLSQDSISQVIPLLNKSHSLFEEIEDKLGEDALSHYASCCFNLGQIICIYTTGGNKVGLPLIESAINIMERLVNHFGQARYQRDLELFSQQYNALKNKK